MSKIITLIFVFVIYIFYSPLILAQTISDIGDLDVSISKTVIVSGLGLNTRYYWKESKLTSVIPIKNYSTVFTDCYIADSSGIIQKDVGPFSLPGLYKLEVYRAGTSTTGRCESTGQPITTPKEFSVGKPTGQSCCEGPGLPVYDKDKDVCRKDLIALPGNPEGPTKCKASGTYCEPESLQCFATKTFVLGGKICKNPTDPDFDKDKHTVCVSSGVKQCGSNQDHAIATAIGCIHTSPSGFIKDFLSFTVAIAGGLAFLMMLLGAFQMLTSAGNPDTLQAGRERFQSAIIGLLFVIFAILMLRIIGVDILGLGEQFGI